MVTVSNAGARRAAIAAALVVGVLGFLPVINWLPGSYRYPGYAAELTGWLSGSAIAIGGGVVLAILSRSLRWMWPAEGARRLGAWVDQHPRAATAVIAAVAGCAYLWVALGVFGPRPLNTDEIAQLRQAEIFLTGHLWAPQPAHPEFFSSALMVDLAGRVYSQFPAGGPAMMALGQLVGGAWIICPLAAVVSVVAFSVIARAAEPDRRIAVAATALFALAPFTVFMSGSQMNHVTALAAILVGVAGMVSDAGFVCGLGLGIAATIRPVDALAFAIPAAVWYLRPPIRWRTACAAAIGVIIPVAILMIVNAKTTGAPLRFGYQVLWGSEHTLGFHRTPWGEPHTPARGLALVNMYFLRLQLYLFESPLPALLPALIALVLARRVGAVDRYLLASGALIVALYFAYWHDGNHLGPRFFYCLGPVLALWTARCVPLLWPRLQAGMPRRAMVFALVVSAVVAVTYAIPDRVREYERNFQTARWARPGVADSAGVRNALVFVREDWGDALLSRLWALGVSHIEARALVSEVDICRLDSAVAALEATPDRNAGERLRPLFADSLKVAVVHLKSGAVLQIDSTRPHDAGCRRQMQAMADGISDLGPILAMGDAGDGNIYASDLGARDTVLMAAYPTRPVYLLKPPAPFATPVFYLVPRSVLGNRGVDLVAPPRDTAGQVIDARKAGR
jgi:hypothetical protein